MSNDVHQGWRDGGVRSNGMAAAPGDRIVDVDVSWLAPIDLGAIDALARLQIAASRCGCWLRFHGADGGLVELVESWSGWATSCICARAAVVVPRGELLRGS